MVGAVKAFAIYTALRLALFVACYIVLAGVYVLVFGQAGSLVWPLLGAVVVSSLLSLKYLARQREAFAAVVDARAHKASARFEERKAREDVD
jgi:hypothetical protein